MKHFFGKRLAAVGAVISMTLSLVACNTDAPDEPEDPPVVIVEDTDFVKLRASGGNTELYWESDGKTYDIYKSKTRYGKYSLVKGNVTDGTFTDDERFCYYKVVENSEGGRGEVYGVSEDQKLFGDNTYVFSPEDDAASVTAAINTVYSGRSEEERMGEFSSERNAFLLKPGAYSNSIVLNTNYYMTFAGLGMTPEDVTVGGLFCGDRADTKNALCNFWRGAENFTVNAYGTTKWATSQSASLRSVKINGDLVLSDGSFGQGYSSGGFLADSYIVGKVNSGSQQQWLCRNCNWSKWEGQVWNMCFAGIAGQKAPTGEYPSDRYTVEDTTSVREKPFLRFDAESGYSIAVPALLDGHKGVSWDFSESVRIERAVPQSKIYFARADRDSAETINKAFGIYDAVVLTPGIYELSDAINIDGDGKILYGMGLSTLMPTAGNACLTTSSSDISVSGILFDAGKSRSDVLARIGEEGTPSSDARLYDCYFRVGGSLEQAVAAECSLRIYTDETVCDNIWLWRADHGNGIPPHSQFSELADWTSNDGNTGAEIYGRHVTFYALMAEHYKKHNVAWYGESGKILFYQSEIAYDVPSQEVWADGDRQGFSSLHVDDGVNEFTARGLGVYSNLAHTEIKLDSAITVPDKAGITVEHACTVSLNGAPSILAVVNGAQGTPFPQGSQSIYLTSYSASN